MNKMYRTMQGREIDMDQLLAKNETMPAVGNVRVNARGDELGPDGSIIRSRENILSEYYSYEPQQMSTEELSLTKVKINSSRKDLNKQNAAIEQPIIEETVEVEEQVKTKSKEAK